MPFESVRVASALSILRSAPGRRRTDQLGYGKSLAKRPVHAPRFKDWYAGGIPVESSASDIRS
jgi:hypothetical protein